MAEPLEATGERLNKLWRIGAAHALYRRDGAWYHRLKAFPGALIDRHGYVLFNTEAEFRDTLGIRVGKRVHIARGISKLPRYVQVQDAEASLGGLSPEVRRAFAAYEEEKRPWREVQRDWFVATHDGTLYPAKYIWALAKNRAPRSFNSREARQGLAEQGLTVISRAQLGADSAAFADQVKAALKLTERQLRKRLASSPRLPARRLASVQVFARNQYVAAAVLRRAKGKCEHCRAAAPFVAKSTGQPFLEVHHRVRLADGGEDTIENALAVCPNCHRQAHYG